jgi:MoaA/NifB/PqqE/SkfB family radical SAM enzyme
MPRYLERYAVNPRWHPKAVEQEFRVKLPGISKEFIAYIDLLAGDVHEGGLWIVDHKWTESFKDPWDLEMDLQIGSYEWLLGELGYDIRGTIYNQILAKKIVPPKLLANGKGLSQDKRQFCDVPTYLEAVERHGFDPDDYTEILAILQQKEFFRETRIYRTPEQTTHFRDEMMLRAKEMSRKAVPIWKSPSSLNCGRCMFRDLCIEQSRGRDIEWLIEAQYVPRERRNGADNAGSPASSAN